MTFLDALTELTEGHCRGIRHSDWAQKSSEQVLCLSGRYLAWTTGEKYRGFSVSQMLDECWLLVDRMPQTEIIPFVAWKHIPTGTMQVNEPVHALNKRNWEKVEGTITRKLKPKVKRREQVFGFLGHFAGGKTHAFDPKYNIFAEWEE